MTELLRMLLESYGGVTPSMRVQTDLSAARAPSYAVSQKGAKVTGEDILGRKSSTATFAFHMRRVSASEKDRQGAHAFLQKLGDWLTTKESIGTGKQKILRIEVNPPALQEAYDDGTAVWSMEIRLFCEDI